MTEPITNFYTNVEKSGICYGYVMNMPPDEWEGRHNFIQYLFPNDEASENVIGSPVLTPVVVERFRDIPLLRERHKNAFIRFLQHIGLSYDDGRVKMVDQLLVKQRVVDRNHNQLRITRILRSMILLGQPELSVALFGVLRDLRQRYGISDTTFFYWETALSLLNKA